MAWFDIVGGLAGGLQQGLSQLQQAQQAKKVEARQQALLEIQQAQERRAGETAQRQIAEENENKFMKLLSMQDPLNIDKNFAAAYPDYAKNYFAINPQTGNVMLQMDPVKRAELQDKAQKSEQRTSFRTAFATPEFQALPPDERIRRGLAGFAAGMDPREVVSGVGPLPPDKYRTLVTGMTSSDKQAEIMSADERNRQSVAGQITSAKITAGARSGGLSEGTLRATVNEPVIESKRALDKAQEKLDELKKLKVAPTSSYVIQAQADVAAKQAAYNAALQERSRLVANTPLAPYYTVAPTPAGVPGFTIKQIK